ncbi:MAG: TylF/MycF family methyltransferase [Azoarcus sp.]|jgi:hypothetical protein|nr:TylF/MycF family methyltransferase [Azoarcus sp.]
MNDLDQTTSLLFKAIAERLAAPGGAEALMGNNYHLADWLRGPFRLEHNPDALCIFKSYPEAADLFARFVKGVEYNNLGDLTRFYALIQNISNLNTRKIVGDFAELGVYKGSSAAVLAHYAAQQNRQLFLFDTFSGFDYRDMTGIDGHRQTLFSDANLANVKQQVGHEDICHYCVGFFPDSIPADVHDRQFAFVSLDCDLYQPMKAGLEFFIPKMSPGGFIFAHDYSSGYWPGCKQAIDESVTAHNLSLVLLPDKSGTAILVI